MAPTLPLFRTSIVILMVLFSINLASTGEYPGVLSRLYKQASQQNRPLIIVVDNAAHANTKDMKQEPTDVGVDEDSKMSLPSYLYKLDQYQKKSPPAKISISKLLGKELDRAIEKKPAKKRVNKPSLQFKSEDDNRFEPSPVIRNLLRISKSLRCDAQNECEDKCGTKYDGRKQDECQDECEDKYSCEEPEEEKTKDECGRSESCEKHDEENFSTRGERFITVTPKCKRC